METISKRQQVINHVRQHSLVRPSEIDALGLPRVYLNQLAKEGIINRIGYGLYQWPDNEQDENIALSEIAKKVPNGVISLLSALSFYELASQNPFEVWMALEQQS